MKYRVAIGTGDGINITEHFGQCQRFSIVDIDQATDEIESIGYRETEFSEQCGDHQQEKINKKIAALQDCQIVLVNRIGRQSEKLLVHNGISPLQFQGSIDDSLKKITKFYKNYQFIRKE